MEDPESENTMIEEHAAIPAPVPPVMPSSGDIIKLEMQR